MTSTVCCTSRSDSLPLLLPSCWPSIFSITARASISARRPMSTKSALNCWYGMSPRATCTANITIEPVQPPPRQWPASAVPPQSAHAAISAAHSHGGLNSAFCDCPLLPDPCILHTLSP